MANENAERCPKCFNKFSDNHWTHDPIITKNGAKFVYNESSGLLIPETDITKRNYKGFCQIKAQIIKELQDNRTQAEIDAGISEPNRTVFSPAKDDVQGFYIFDIKHIKELRESTEKILLASGQTKETFLNYDEEETERQNPHQMDWIDPILDNWKGNIKDQHIEDLRKCLVPIEMEKWNVCENQRIIKNHSWTGDIGVNAWVIAGDLYDPLYTWYFTGGSYHWEWSEEYHRWYGVWVLGGQEAGNSAYSYAEIIDNVMHFGCYVYGASWSSYIVAPANATCSEGWLYGSWWASNGDASLDGFHGIFTRQPKITANKIFNIESSISFAPCTFNGIDGFSNTNYPSLSITIHIRKSGTWDEKIYRFNICEDLDYYGGEGIYDYAGGTNEAIYMHNFNGIRQADLYQHITQRFPGWDLLTDIYIEAYVGGASQGIGGCIESDPSLSFSNGYVTGTLDNIGLKGRT